MIFFKLIFHYLNIFIRHLYWLLNLSKINNGKNIRYQFPIVCEGKGKIVIGKNSSIGRRAELKIGRNSLLSIGDNSSIAMNVELIVGENSSFKAGACITIENRTRLYIKNHWEIGNNIKIAGQCSIFSREHESSGILKIGDGTHIGDNTIMDICDDLIIGNEVAIGPNCVLYTHDHDFSNPQLASWKGGILKKPILIKDGAWIGSGVTILPGITIGRRAVLAAGSVVTKDIPANTVWGGVPATLIKRN